jgi:ribosomal protein S6 kinase-like
VLLYLICNYFSDLNPDSILLNECGDIMLTFIGRWPSVDWKADYKMCENMYAAPEVSSIQNVTCVSDWWSVGALIFEMLTGKVFVDLIN